MNASRLLEASQVSLIDDLQSLIRFRKRVAGGFKACGKPW